MAGGNPMGEKSDGVNIAEFVLYNTDRIDQFEDKAGFTPWKENYKDFGFRVSDVGSTRFDINTTI